MESPNPFNTLVHRNYSFYLLDMKNITDSDSNEILLSPGLFPEIVEEIRTKCGKHGIRVALCGSKDNIWVRDYMPVQLTEDCFLEYQYTPDYLLSSKRYSKFLVTSEHFVEDTLGRTTKQLGLVIDGGNVVKLADKYVAMTEKVMVENPQYSQADIEAIIRDSFHREVLWLPWDKAEMYGHSDGIINYLNGTVVITNYSDFDKNIARQVHERLDKAGFEVKELEYSFKKGFHLRSWCYVNFVETNNVILVPRLGVDDDNEAVEQLSKKTSKPIETINALPLVRRGGAIHCVTWNIFQ